jgi:hypothetical protein
MKPQFLAGVAAAFLVVASSAAAQHGVPAGPSTSNLQGDQSSWINDPHWHAYYDMTRAAFAQGPAKVDVAAYEQRSYALFRDFGASRGMDPAKMQDHLKLIPRQVVQIVRDDPTVLDSYKNFLDATMGPQ